MNEGEDLLEDAFDAATGVLAEQAAYLDAQPDARASVRLGGEHELYAPSYEFFALLSWSVFLSMFTSAFTLAIYRKWSPRLRVVLDADQLQALKQEIVEALRGGDPDEGRAVPEETRQLAGELLRKHGWPELEAREAVTRIAAAVQDGPHRRSSRYSHDLFISHASEDKVAIARPLHDALVQRGARVWFDEATLQLGDSLRRKIDEGLARCRFGIVILSPSFLAKEWPQRELDGLFARETLTGERAILPVWHQLDPESLLRYSPLLADRVAARSEEGVPAIVDKVFRALGNA